MMTAKTAVMIDHNLPPVVLRTNGDAETAVTVGGAGRGGACFRTMALKNAFPECLPEPPALRLDFEFDDMRYGRHNKISHDSHCRTVNRKTFTKA